MNTLQTNFELWMANHYHVHRSIPVLTIRSDSKLTELIAEDDFLYNFTNYQINSDYSFIDDTYDFVVLQLTKLSDMYNKSILLGKENLILKDILFSYTDSYRITDDIIELIIKNPIFTEDNLDIIITVPQLVTNDEFEFDGDIYNQKPQTIHINKALLASFEVVTVDTPSLNTLYLNIDTLTNAFVGIPSTPIILESIIDDSAKSALNHISDLTKHFNVLAPESGLIETAKYNQFATPNWTKEHPLYTDSKFLISSNDKTLSLNIIKDELNTNKATVTIANERPLDAMFRGSSSNPNWLRGSYFSGEERSDVDILRSVIQDTYNYEVEANETSNIIQTFSKQQNVPVANVITSPNSIWHEASFENRVLRLVKNNNVSVEPGNVMFRMPIMIRLAPNTRNKSYMYSYFYGKKKNNLNKSYLGGYKGQGLYYNSKSDLIFNISKEMFFEKILILGSPYECFNMGAEHVYTSMIEKDYSNPTANFNGFYIKERSLSEIRKEETKEI